MIRRVVLPTCRACIRCLMTPRERLSGLERFLRSIFFLCLFCPLHALVRLRALVLGPLEVEGVTSFGSMVRCRVPDLIQTYIYLFGVWEPDLTAFIARRLSLGDVFIDVGANVGYDTLLALACVGDEGRVVAIEASPTVARELRFNLERSDRVLHVTVVEAAASDVPRTLHLRPGPSHNIGRTSTTSAGEDDDQGIKALPLPELVSAADLRGARLIKIDVEGAEPAVLAGLAPAIGQLRADVELLVELSPAWWGQAQLTPRDVLRPFIDVGFHVYELENNYWPWRYLWPRRVSPPRRLRRNLAARVKRLDVVLSRIDAETL